MELLPENITEEQIQHVVIKEVVEGKPVTIHIKSGAILDEQGKATKSCVIKCEDEEMNAYLHKMEQMFLTVAEAFDDMLFEAIHLDPNPLDAPMLMIDTIRATMGEDVGYVSGAALDRFSSQFGWLTPIVKPMPFSLAKALLGEDTETVLQLRERLRQQPSLVRESSYQPEFKLVYLAADTQEELELVWDI